MQYEELEELMDVEGMQFVTDGEGPVTKNDNAFELCQNFVERGDELFSLISKYDDVLADVFHTPDYKAGDTLRLILPFLKAYGVTDEAVKRYSEENVLLMPGADRTMRFVNKLMPSYLVSTSYEQYVKAVCEIIGFPFENAYCTSLRLDSYRIDQGEVERLKAYAGEIADMPMLEIPEEASSLHDFSDRDRETIERLDEIFWEEMTDLSTYQLIVEVNPVGGDEKASAIVDAQRTTGVGLENTMYVGDSITDVEAFQIVRDGGGITVSFNGNAYAVREAEIAVMSPDTVVTSVLAEVFNTNGREGVINLVENWSLDFLKSTGMVHDYLVRELERVFPEYLPTVERVTYRNIDRLSQESSRYRKTVRGKEIGQLG
ncbi:MAG: hypothetical protein ACLFUV_05055 [Methanomassiliicoccales archaeon]